MHKKISILMVLMIFSMHIIAGKKMDTDTPKIGSKSNTTSPLNGILPIEKTTTAPHSVKSSPFSTDIMLICTTCDNQRQMM